MCWGLLVWLPVLACSLMHLFMHSGLAEEAVIKQQGA